MTDKNEVWGVFQFALMTVARSTEAQKKEKQTKPGSTAREAGRVYHISKST
jgi:hypothetical protein